MLATVAAIVVLYHAFRLIVRLIGGPVWLWESAFTAAPVGIVFLAVFHRPRDVTAVRKAKGLCVLCGYDLRGNVSGVCPECGGGRRWAPTHE